MRKLIALFLLMGSLPSYSQHALKPGEPYEAYCYVVFSLDLIFHSDLCVESLCNEEGKSLKLYDNMGVMSYMAKRGWKYMDTITEKDGDVCLFMKKMVTSDEQILEGLHFYKDFRKQKGKKEKQD